MRKNTIREMLAFEDLTPEEKERRGILGRLYGPCASISVPTRNGRGYNESLWENVFEKNEIVKEMFDNGGIPMELDHPVDREETDSSKIAAMMPEAPKRDKDGHLICYVDLINTPMGNIAYQLAKYGFNLGISSRGSGDIITDDSGNEIVDPDTYDFTTFDLVLLPAVKDARLVMAEGLDKNKNMGKLRNALRESLDKATEADRKVMAEAIEHLGIDLNKNESIPNKGGDKTKTEENLRQTKEEPKEAVNDGSESIIKSLQESLTANKELEAKVKQLQEELAVSNAKAGKAEEELGKAKDAIVRLTAIAKSSKERQERITGLEEELGKAKQTIDTLRRRPIREKMDASKPLREEVARKDEEIKASKAEIESLTEQLTTLKEGSSGEIKKLKESLESERKSSEATIKGLKENLSRKDGLIERYKKLTDSIATQYIECRARQLGVKPVEITNRLRESYTLKDVDKVCEELMAYKVNISKLPFELDSKSVVTLKESKHIGVNANPEFDDDYISEDTLRMAGMR